MQSRAFFPEWELITKDLGKAGTALVTIKLVTFLSTNFHAVTLRRLPLTC